MDWVKLSTDYFDDDRIESAHDALEVMFVRGIARAGKLEREGFIPQSSLSKLTRRRRYEPLVDELVELGLWHRVPGGIQVANWGHWQDSLDELARRRAKDRERQRKRRQRLKEDEESTVSRDVSRDVTPTEGEEELEREFLGGLGKEGAPRVRADDKPPPRQCPQHTNDPDPPPCFACKQARLAYEQWQREQAQPPPRPPHCGQCDPDTRQVELDEHGRSARCPRCHPETRKAQA